LTGISSNSTIRAEWVNLELGLLEDKDFYRFLISMKPAAAPPCFLQNAALNINRPASGVRSVSALTDSSKRRPIGTEISTDKNLLQEFIRFG